MTSLAASSPAPKPKPSKALPERQTFSNSGFSGVSAPLPVAQPALPVAEKPVPSSPLASLNSIVAQIGGAEGSKTTTAKPLQFSMGSSLSQGFEGLGDKTTNLPQTKPNSILQMGKPPAFSTALNVSFGNSESPKPEAPNRELPVKNDNVLSFGSKDPKDPRTQTGSLFADNLFKSPTVTITKTVAPPAKVQTPNLGSALTISLKESPATTQSQSVFSFANPPAVVPAVTSAPAATVDIPGLTALSEKTQIAQVQR